MADEKMCDNPRCSRKFTPKNARHKCCSPKCAEERRKTVILIGETVLKNSEGVDEKGVVATGLFYDCINRCGKKRIEDVHNVEECGGCLPFPSMYVLLWPESPNDGQEV